MGYYLFNREKIFMLQRTNIIIKELKKAAKYYISNREVL